MADRRKKPEHDDAWWADQRHAYIEKNDILLSDYPSWEWVSPYDFWRTIFPEGFLQPRGEEVETLINMLGWRSRPKVREYLRTPMVELPPDCAAAAVAEARSWCARFE